MAQAGARPTKTPSWRGVARGVDDRYFGDCQQCGTRHLFGTTHPPADAPCPVCDRREAARRERERQRRLREYEARKVRQGGGQPAR